jgi:2-keto-4-pentenoate hydratase/2-oxohepta-3-ene-1,7-dioic acid hydratase in catechol pathway
MKLLRYGPPGREQPGLLDDHGQIRSLSGIVSELSAQTFAPEALQALRETRIDALPLVPGKPRLGAPWTGISKFIAIGLNYGDHAAESGMATPTEPVVFTKATSCIVGPDDDIMLPKDSTRTDWEVELGVVVGRKASYVSESDALDYVAGYCLVNDVSEREYQLERGGTWDKGKGCDTFGPIGPYLVTRDEIPDPQALDMWLDVNGSRMQSGNTRTMIFPVRVLVSYLSRFMTLLPGDLITTGTPPGVGMARKPSPVYLKAGDVINLGIAGLGVQQQQVVRWKASAE